MSLSKRQKSCQRPVIACRVNLAGADSFNLFVWPDSGLVANDRRGFYHQPISSVLARSCELGIQTIDNWQNGFRPEPEAV